MNAIVQSGETRSVMLSMAERYGMDPRAFESTLLATVMPSNVQPSREQVAAFLLVAKQYGLNPFTREIFAFPAKGGIQPVVSVDGWLKLINSDPQFDGMTFEDSHAENGELQSITCRIYRKDRQHPVEVTEYMRECKRSTDPWKQWPARMLRHKAAIQAARYAFGFSGIVDPDEAERIQSVQATPAVADLMPRAKSAPKAETAPLEHVVEIAGEEVEAPAPVVEAPKPLSDSLRRVLAERARKAGVTMEDITAQYGEITTVNLQQILTDLRAMTQEPAA